MFDIFSDIPCSHSIDLIAGDCRSINEESYTFQALIVKIAAGKKNFLKFVFVLVSQYFHFAMVEMPFF